EVLPGGDVVGMIQRVRGEACRNAWAVACLSSPASHGSGDGRLQAAGAEVPPPHVAGAPVVRQAPRGEDVLPAQLPRRPRVLAVEGVRHFAPAVPGPPGVGVALCAFLRLLLAPGAGRDGSARSCAMLRSSLGSGQINTARPGCKKKLDADRRPGDKGEGSRASRRYAI